MPDEGRVIGVRNAYTHRRAVRGERCCRLLYAQDFPGRAAGQGSENPHFALSEIWLKGGDT